MGRAEINQKRKTKRTKRNIVILLAAVSCVLFFCINIDQRAHLPMPGNVIYKGDTYTYNQNLTNILFMGVDYGTGYTENSIGGHQADTLLVMSIDNTTKKAKFINIPRDLTTRIEVYDIAGKFAHVTVGPICLAHSYGTDEKNGSRLTESAVSYLLYGVPIQNYMSMNIDGISIANDLVGGVQLEILEDFTMVGPTLKKGATVTLNGVEAMNYVRQRSLPGMSGSNLDRMKRQVQYMQSFIEQVKIQTQSDSLFFVKLLYQMRQYISINIDVFQLTSVFKVLFDQGVSAADIQTVAGSMTETGYIADDEALEKMILEVFYIKK